MNQKKTNRLQVLLTEKDRKVLDEAARKAGLDTSTWARTALVKAALATDKQND